MNKEAAMELADALESGKYQQGRKRLQTGNTYCCLGVACLLHKEKAVIKDGKLLGGTLQQQPGIKGALGFVCGSGDFPLTLLSVEDQELLCMARKAPSLVALNDELEWDFPRIAKFIRKNWEYII